MLYAYRFNKNYTNMFQLLLYSLQENKYQRKIGRFLELLQFSTE